MNEELQNGHQVLTANPEEYVHLVVTIQIREWEGETVV